MSNSSQKGFAVIPLVIILAVLAVGGYWVWQRRDKTTEFTTSWKTYRNEQFGFEVKYPKEWDFEAQSTDGTYNFLDIHLDNSKIQSDSPSCPQDFIGLEIQVGHPKNSNLSFESFVKSRVSEKIGGLEPSGKIETLTRKIAGKTVFKVENSGWDSGCAKEGYFIGQSDDRYSYVFTGYNMSDSLARETIDQILSTFKFLK